VALTHTNAKGNALARGREACSSYSSYILASINTGLGLGPSNSNIGIAKVSPIGAES
jgi:hypothetical protein